MYKRQASSSKGKATLEDYSEKEAVPQVEKEAIMSEDIAPKFPADLDRKDANQQVSSPDEGKEAAPPYEESIRQRPSQPENFAGMRAIEPDPGPDNMRPKPSHSTSNPKHYDEPTEEWQTGLFDCFGSPGLCQSLQTFVGLQPQY